MSTALVKYAADMAMRQALMKYHPLLKNATKAYDTYNKFKPYAKPLLKKAYTSYRKKKQQRKKQLFSTTNIGAPKDESASKRNEPVAEDNAKNTRTLYIYDTINLSQGITGAASDRLRNSIFVSGIRVCALIKNKMNKPLLFNFAVVSRKNGDNVTTQDFFRYNAGSTRGRAFATSLDSNEMHCSAINTDLYTVLKHERFVLKELGTPEGFSNTNWSNYMKLDRWIKVNRQMKFDDNGSAYPSQRLFVLMWADGWGNATGALVDTDAWQCQQRITMYFREPRP